MADLCLLRLLITSIVVLLPSVSESLRSRRHTVRGVLKPSDPAKLSRGCVSVLSNGTSLPPMGSLSSPQKSRIELAIFFMTVNGSLKAATQDSSPDRRLANYWLQGFEL